MFVARSTIDFLRVIFNSHIERKRKQRWQLTIFNSFALLIFDGRHLLSDCGQISDYSFVGIVHVLTRCVSATDTASINYVKLLFANPVTSIMFSSQSSRYRVHGDLALKIPHSLQNNRLSYYTLDFIGVIKYKNGFKLFIIYMFLKKYLLSYIYIYIYIFSLFNPFTAGPSFIRQNLTSIDVRIRRLNIFLMGT